MNTYWQAILVVIFVLGASKLAICQEPDFGNVWGKYGEHGIAAITYKCHLQDDGVIDCKISQITARYKLSEEDAKKRIEKAKMDFYSEQSKGWKGWNEVCQYNSSILEIYKRGEIPSFSRLPTKEANSIFNAFLGLSERQKSDTMRDLNASKEFCNSQTLDNFIKMNIITIEKEKNTCVINSANRFSQKFNRTDENTWTTVYKQSERECGLVYLDRFEGIKSKFGSGLEWSYIMKEIITNPNGQLYGKSCHDVYRNVAEKEFKYEPYIHPDMKCEYIEFDSDYSVNDIR